MKKLIFCGTVAILCCGSSSSFAQMRILSGAPTPAPKLVATQADFDGKGLAAVDDGIANPFDMLGNAATANQAPPPPAVGPVQPQAEISEDPQSLPVGLRHRHRRGIVDTMANYGQVASVPNATHTPVDWCSGATRAPNHVANMLMREQCVQGLWDGYEAQRAAECAHMWAKLTATRRCHGCGHCSKSGCTTGCASGGCASQPINRYQPSSCDGCTQCAAAKNAEHLKQAAQLASAVGPAKDASSNK